MYLYQFLISRKIHVAVELLQKALGALPHSLHRSALYWWVFFFSNIVTLPLPRNIPVHSVQTPALCAHLGTLRTPQHSEHTPALCANHGTLIAPQHSSTTSTYFCSARISPFCCCFHLFLSTLLPPRRSVANFTYFSALCSHLDTLFASSYYAAISTYFFAL